MNAHTLIVAGLLGLLSVHPADAAKTLAPASPHFALCGEGRRITCVVDGDTIWLDGQKIRFEDIDAPEISEPHCPSERQLGLKARDRLLVLINAGGWHLARAGSRERDRYGRLLRNVVTTGGDTLGLELYREGLAHLWDGRKHPWC